MDIKKIGLLALGLVALYSITKRTATTQYSTPARAEANAAAVAFTANNPPLVLSNVGTGATADTRNFGIDNPQSAALNDVVASPPNINLENMGTPQQIGWMTEAQLQELAVGVPIQNYVAPSPSYVGSAGGGGAVYNVPSVGSEVGNAAEAFYKNYSIWKDTPFITDIYARRNALLNLYSLEDLLGYYNKIWLGGPGNPQFIQFLTTGVYTK